MTRSLKARLLRHAAVLGLVAGAVLARHVERLEASGEDIVAIVEDRAAAHGVSPAWLVAVARCESTLNPFATNGRYLGLFQLGSPGMLDDFFALGYSDVWSAWQQADFTAMQFARGRSGAWSCA